MNNWFTRWWDFVDSRAIVRRVMTLGTFAMTVWVTNWSMNFAETSTRSGSEMSMILGAIGVPLTVLMGYLFSAYTNSKAS